MKLLILLLLIISTNSFSKDWDKAYKNFGTGNNTTNNIKLRWVQVDNVIETCKMEATSHGLELETDKFEACSFWGVDINGSWCYIITKRELNLATLGHEVRHCFQGNWH